MQQSVVLPHWQQESPPKQQTTGELKLHWVVPGAQGLEGGGPPAAAAPPRHRPARR